MTVATTIVVVIKMATAIAAMTAIVPTIVAIAGTNICTVIHINIKKRGD